MRINLLWRHAWYLELLDLMHVGYHRNLPLRPMTFAPRFLTLTVGTVYKRSYNRQYCGARPWVSTQWDRVRTHDRSYTPSSRLLVTQCVHFMTLVKYSGETIFSSPIPSASLVYVSHSLFLPIRPSLTRFILTYPTAPLRASRITCANTSFSSLHCRLRRLRSRKIDTRIESLSSANTH